MIDKIGFGGSCHWCTEAIFSSLKGVISVEQGWIAAKDDPDDFSEAVIVNYDHEVISLEILVAVHLHTHSCTARHSMRGKYKSAIYTFDMAQIEESGNIIQKLQPEFDQPIITQVLEFREFRLNKADYLDYYYSNPDKPFCKNIVNPKLKLLIRRFSKQVDMEKLGHL